MKPLVIPSMQKREFLRNLAGASLGTAAVGALAALPLPADASRRTTQRVVVKTAEERRRQRFLNLPLLTHEGKVVHFYDDLIKDKTVLINFMYASCNEICPMTTVNLRKVQNELGDRVGKDVFMYSISLAPEKDTPKILASYAQIFKLKPGWQLLTGTPDTIEKLRFNLGFFNKDPEIDKDRSRHTGMVRFGIEPLERWGSAPGMTNPKYLAEYVRWLEPKGKKPYLPELTG